MKNKTVAILAIAILLTAGAAFAQVQCPAPMSQSGSTISAAPAGGPMSPLVANQPGGPVPQLAPKDFPHLLGTPGFSEKAIRDHLTLYREHVDFTNRYKSEIKRYVMAGRVNTLEFMELQRRVMWEYNAVLLHELFFSNLGGPGRKSPDANSPLYRKIVADFGSFDAWLQKFRGTALIRGDGYAILYLDPNTNRLVNVRIDEYNKNHFPMARPILVMDVFEHGYVIDFGPNRAAYVDASMRLVNWEVVEGRFGR